MTGMITEIHRAAFDDGPGVRTAIFFKGCPLRCYWCHNPETQSFEPELMNGRLCGKRVTTEEIMSVVRQDASHYSATGGGMTVTGGEPLAQPIFLQELATQAKAEGIHVCIETSGYGNVDTLIPYIDLWYFDIKGLPEDYSRLTGGSFEVVERSLISLTAAGCDIVFRCPIIPGVHDNERYDDYLRELTTRYPAVLRLDRLPYHRLGSEKYAALGRAEEG